MRRRWIALNRRRRRTHAEPLTEPKGAVFHLTRLQCNCRQIRPSGETSCAMKRSDGRRTEPSLIEPFARAAIVTNDLLLDQGDSE